MRPMNMKNATSKTQLLLALVVAVTLSLAPAAFAAAPGITGTAGTAGTFNLTAQDAYLNQPDGEAVYSWGYGCVAGSAPTFVPAATFAFTPTCNTMQVPGPTMVVTEGQTVTINLTNNLPTAAGNTSILFPGFNVSTSCTATTPVGQQGLLTCEAAPGSHGDLHVHRLSAGHARVLQRNAGRPPDRDGALRRGHCVAGDSARQLRQRHNRKPTCTERRITGQRPASRDFPSRTSACLRQPTTTPRAATTGNTCSSGPRWIPEFTARQRRKFRPRRAARRAPWDAVSTYRPSPTIRPTS